MLYRIRRKNDGLFFGAREWGVSHSKSGKFYNTLGQARGAAKQSELKSTEHEYVEYEIKEVRSILLDI